MCRVEERIYVDEDGRRTAFEEVFRCEHSRGTRLCTKVRREVLYESRSLEGFGDASSPASYDSSTPTGNAARVTESVARKDKRNRLRRGSYNDSSSTTYYNPPSPIESNPAVIETRRPTQNEQHRAFDWLRDSNLERRERFNEPQALKRQEEKLTVGRDADFRTGIFPADYSSFMSSSRPSSSRAAAAAPKIFERDADSARQRAEKKRQQEEADLEMARKIIQEEEARQAAIELGRAKARAAIETPASRTRREPFPERRRHGREEDKMRRPEKTLETSPLGTPFNPTDGFPIEAQIKVQSLINQENALERLQEEWEDAHSGIQNNPTDDDLPSHTKKEVGFMKDPVTQTSRPVSAAESWAAYDFELHARKCTVCQDPYTVHFNHEQLCDEGHRLAQEVARHMYMKADGGIYSTVEDDHRRTRVELPAGHSQVKGLLKAIEQSHRQHNGSAFVSTDRTYSPVVRSPPQTKDSRDWRPSKVSVNREHLPIRADIGDLSEDKSFSTDSRPITRDNSTSPDPIPAWSTSARSISTKSKGRIAKLSLKEATKPTNLNSDESSSGEGPAFSSAIEDGHDDPRKRRSNAYLDGATIPGSNDSKRMKRKRTRKGCLTCRKRRIKCGEERPTCTNCVVSKRQCEGYNQRVIFKAPIGDWPGHPGSISTLQQMDSKERDETHLVVDDNKVMEHTKVRYHNDTGVQDFNIRTETTGTQPTRHEPPESTLTELSLPNHPQEVLSPNFSPIEELHHLLQGPRKGKIGYRKLDQLDEEKRYQTPISQDLDDSSTAASSNDGSIFSIASLESWATDLSQSSGYSTKQIATATQEVLLVLVNDEVLRPLFIQAINGDIGPVKFVNNFRRLLKRYSEDLKEEAQEAVQLLATKLVAVKARYLAHAILERFQQGTIAPDLEPSSVKPKERTVRGNDDSDEEEAPSVDDSVFENLNIGREFLVESEGFRKLRSRLEKLVHGANSRTQKSTSKESKPDPEISNSASDALRQGFCQTGNLDLESFFVDRPYPSGSVLPSRPSQSPPEGMPLHFVNPLAHFLGSPPSDQVFQAWAKRLRGAAGEEDRDILVSGIEPEFWSVYRFGVFLSQLTELREHHRKALSYLGPERFVAVYCGTLEIYYQALHKEAQFEIEKEALHVLQKKTNSFRIAETIIKSFTEPGAPDILQEKEYHQSNTRAVEREDDLGIDGADPTESKCRSNMANFRQTFFLRGPAFREFSLNIWLLSLKSSLREVIDNAPSSGIQISSKDNTALSNRLKLSVERYTGAPWDWWPLNPPVPQVPIGMKRLEWQFCNQSIYEIVEEGDAEMIQDVLSQRDEHPHSCYCPICCGQHLIDGEGDWWDDKGSSFRAQTFCAPAPQTGVWEALNQYFSMTVPALVRTKNPSASSSNSAQSRATIQSTTSSSTAFSTTGQSTQSASASSSNSGSTQTTSSNCSNQSLYIPPSPVRVLFGVQGRRWSLELEKIILAGLSNDPTFFRELKARYKKHRSSIKLLLSPYRFRFCRFVKFEKFDAGRIISQGDDLPDYHGYEHDYEYTPRPGEIPLINPKVFAVCLNACNPKSCFMSLLNPWHDCIRLPRHSDKIRRIPKKKSDFDVTSDDLGDVAWGLEADYAISFAFLAIYHFVPLLAALAFWIYWLTVHPGDFQNAAVPFLTVLALFAAFWMPFSLLK